MIEFLLGAACLVFAGAAFLGGAGVAVRGLRAETTDCAESCACECHRD